jgi:hypothetical protein
MAQEEHFERGAGFAPESGITRRKLIATGATLAAAGVAVGAGGTVAVSAISDNVTSGSAGAAPDKPVMVHLLDASNGTFDGFVGEQRFSFTDRALAAEIIRNAANAV